MIFAISGILTHVTPEGLVLETASGVSYLIATHKRANPLQIGAPLKLWTLQVIREEQIFLYGFADLGERELFIQLLTVSGVGPRLALALLENLGASSLINAVLKANSRALTLTPGVGTKTAQRIVLELQGKFEKLPNRPALTVDAPQEEVYQALLALGYSGGEINQALQGVQLSSENPPADWIRACIQFLSRS